MPTTHIFKLPLGLVGGRQADFGTSVDNEWLCLRLFKAYGLSTAKAHISADYGIGAWVEGGTRIAQPGSAGTLASGGALASPPEQ
jgi:serine/threonine protein kinase HipA of HipAB toxin-antitoxin module